MASDKAPCTYILASRPRGTLYIGVTSNLLGRLHQHRSGITRGFTARYSIYRLVRFDMAETMEQAILRESSSSAGIGHGRSTSSSRTIPTGSTSPSAWVSPRCRRAKPSHAELVSASIVEPRGPI